jgi:Rod binding domain-containing protein
MDLLDTKSIQQGIPGLLADKQISLLKNNVDSGDAKKSEKLKSVSKQFESIMTHQLLTAMRTTVPKSELLGGFSGDMYQSMMDQELANQVSKGKGLGLSDMVLRQLTQLENKVNSAKLESPGVINQPAPVNPASLGLAIKSSDFIEANAGAKVGSMMKAANSYRGNR